jgi:hypothetical protein
VIGLKLVAASNDIFLKGYRQIVEHTVLTNWMRVHKETDC